MKKESKDYKRGFKSGVIWAFNMYYTYGQLMVMKDLKKALKNL
jgi:hypothetical protein